MLETLYGWLQNAIGPLIKRGLAAIGLGWITFEGVQQFWQDATNGFLASWNAIPSEVMEFLQLCGIATAFGIIMGALATAFSILALKYLGFIEE